MSIAVKSAFLLLFVLSSFGLISAPVEYLPVPAKDVVKHTYYTLSYNEDNEQANWVYYCLTDSMVLQSKEERTNRFAVDKLVKTGSAKSSDYTKSGFDRGHLCPAADMGFNRAAMEESFLMSNVSPQLPDFNRGIWKSLEEKVREWAREEHRLYIVTGPVFKNDQGEIGTNRVTVPGYFFKVIFDPESNPKMIAFLIPNAKTNRPLTDFAVPTDQIEQLTGFDFFSQLPDDPETKLEGNVALGGWFAGYQTESTIASQAPETRRINDSKNELFYGVFILVILLVVLWVILKGKRKR